ncbi:MAG: glycoside hydrolase family 65 protein, partial [Angelakisella sp.]
MNFIVTENGFDKNKVMLDGTRFFVGNGYMGCRGTLEEFTKSELVGITLAGVYDQVGDSWREPVNAPNGLYTRLFVDGSEINALAHEPKEHKMQLDLKRAALTRESEYEDVTVRTTRFASADDLHLLVLRYSITP